MTGLSVACWAALAVEDARRRSVPLWLVLVFLALCAGVLLSGTWQYPLMLISPAASFGFFGLAFVLVRGKMGGSDVLVATGLSVFVAWYDLPYAWVGATVAGVGYIALKSLLLRNRGLLRARVPFIPFLGLGYFGWALFVELGSKLSLISKAVE
jgi:Flp pilus assembly protein protease CpaA